ncbi:hypothetical protein ACFLYX_03735 [Chloroflexota bacterium]
MTVEEKLKKIVTSIVRKPAADFKSAASFKDYGVTKGGLRDVSLEQMDEQVRRLKAVRQP